MLILRSSQRCQWFITITSIGYCVITIRTYHGPVLNANHNITYKHLSIVTLKIESLYRAKHAQKGFTLDFFKDNCRITFYYFIVYCDGIMRSCSVMRPRWILLHGGNSNKDMLNVLKCSRSKVSVFITCLIVSLIGEK